MGQLLKLENIEKSFPGVKALNGINLSLDRGQIHALLGENGAGKSTLMKILCGIYQPDNGIISIDGKQVRFKNYREAIAAGIGIIFQEFSLIPYLNAVENIFLNRELKNKVGLLDRSTMKKQAITIFKGLDVNINLNTPVENLSIAEQQFVEIAKALSLHANILVLDEPTATLTPNEARHLFQIMRDLQSTGVGMFFISHHLEEIFEICNTISVLRDGEYIGTTKVEDTNIDKLVQMMVGRAINQTYLTARTLESEKYLEVSLKRYNNAPIDNFFLKKGEILGFAGLVGSGRTELVNAMIGADSCYSKTILLDKNEIHLNSPSDALKAGFGLLPENRKTQGLVLSFSVQDNIWLNQHPSKFGLINAKFEKKVSDDLIRKVGIKTPSGETIVGNLSGGNQQKVVIARWLNHDCKILIFDEPTRGIDVGAKAEIYQQMRTLTQTGVSIIMISSELPEVIGVSDRILVFREGHIVATLEGDDMNSETILLHATGANEISNNINEQTINSSKEAIS
ncbi:ATP-binding component of sugar ABC transporter [Gammaproteobacteria bacterium]|nr:ATP-binding component of sugar ABC transporter [Gammaproteobacteria bacterium]